MTCYTEKIIKSRLPIFANRVSQFIVFAFLFIGATPFPLSAQNGDRTSERLSASFAQVAKKVEAAVVNIETKTKVALGSRGRGGLDGSVGSGFIVDKAGFILTNYHVVDDAARITVRLHTNEEYPAKIIGADEETDLAVLKIEAGRDLSFLPMGDSDRVEVGDWVLAIGSPFGLAQTVTAGIISQTRRETPDSSPFQKFIQTDAAINRGNSGGPLVNMNGEVIGVNSMIASTTGDYNGIGFALPSKEALNVYQQIRQYGKVRRGYLGVILESVKAEFAKVYGLTEARGAIVTSINDSTSAAAKGGLQDGDIIVEFDGTSVLNSQDLIEKVAGTTPEKEVSITFLRENGMRLERKTVRVKLSERPTYTTSLETVNPKKLPLEGSSQRNLQPFGLTVSEVTPQIASLFKIEGQPGVLVREINPSSYLADLRNSSGTALAINQGDIIQRINRVSVFDVRTFNEIAARLKIGDAVVLHILHFDRQTRSVTPRIVQFTVQ